MAEQREALKPSGASIGDAKHPVVQQIVHAEEDANLIGWLLYDGGCGICTQAVLRWQKGLLKQHIGIRPLQHPRSQAALKIATQDDLLSDVRLLFKDGTQLRGANVYRYLFKRIWWAYPLYVLSQIPLLHWAFDRIYKFIVSNRHRISRTCKVPT